MKRAAFELSCWFGFRLKTGVAGSNKSPIADHSMGYFYSPYYEVALAIALVLLALVAPSHFSSRNTGTILYICWVFLGNLVVLINKLVWSDHVRNIAPAWCDFSQSLRLLCLFGCSITDKRFLSPRRPSSRPFPGCIPL